MTATVPPPYTLAVPPFPFRALTALAGKAPMGGARESALAVLMAARLADGSAAPTVLPAGARRVRADAARIWLSALALPAPVRASVLKLIDTSATDDRHAVAAAVTKVTEVTATYLDRQARLELARLAARLSV